MFSRNKVKIDRELWEKIVSYAEAAGYSSPQEFVQHALEKEIAILEEAETDEEVQKKLRGLGYIS